MREESRERCRLTAAVERERVHREEVARSAYIGWLTSKYRQRMGDKPKQ